MKWMVFRACLIPAALLITAQAPNTGKSPFWDDFAFERGTQDLSLETARRLGVFNSLIKDPLDLDVDDARADIEIADSNFDPVLTLNSNVADSDQAPETPSEASLTAQEHVATHLRSPEPLREATNA